MWGRYAKSVNSFILKPVSGWAFFMPGPPDILYPARRWPRNYTKLAIVGPPTFLN